MGTQGDFARGEFFELFRTETTKELGVLVEALDKKDGDTLSLIGHRLRGRARIMGYMGFEELADRLEKSADQAKWEEAGAALQELRVEFERIAQRESS